MNLFPARCLSLPLALLAGAMLTSPSRPGLVIPPISLGDGTNTGVSAVNDSGTAVGQFTSGTNIQGFLRDPAGNVTTISLGNGTQTQLSSVNGSGESGGVFVDAGGHAEGFLRDSAGNITAISL